MELLSATVNNLKGYHSGQATNKGGHYNSLSLLTVGSHFEVQSLKMKYKLIISRQ